MHWVDKFLPSCCKSRPNPPESVKKSSSLLNELQISPLSDDQIIESHSNSPKLKSISVQFGESLIKPVDSLKVPEYSQVLTDSRRSTGFTEHPIPHSILPAQQVVLSPEVPGPEVILCSFCNKETQGYCPACPFMRYCSDCYSVQHTEKQKFHLFIAYSLQKKATIKEFNNLAVIKKIK